MRHLYSSRTHNINSFSIGKVIVCSTNWLIQKRFTQYIGKLLIPEEKLSFGQPLKHEDFRINQLVLQILYFKSYPKLNFCGCDYCAEVSYS